MRFGAPLLEKFDSPGQWVQLVKQHGYAAANSPVSASASDNEILQYAKAAKEADIIIAEQGAWNANPISIHSEERDRAIALCIRSLEVAELLNARCCVALSGSKAAIWDAPHGDNFSEQTFQEVVAYIQKVIDAVQPKNTFFTLESMPWTLPYDTASQKRLIEAVDRAAFATHFDPVNMVNSIEKYYGSGRYIREFVNEMGASIRVCHVKDIQVQNSLTLHLDEAIPGDGELDFDTLFTCLNALDEDLPIMTEHLSLQEEYDKGKHFILGKLEALGITLRQTH